MNIKQEDDSGDISFIEGGREVKGPCAEQFLDIFDELSSSGLAKFSVQDADTVMKRMNTKVDEGHCVVGNHEVMCEFSRRTGF